MYNDTGFLWDNKTKEIHIKINHRIFLFRTFFFKIAFNRHLLDIVHNRLCSYIGAVIKISHKKLRRSKTKY
jgi:hypothetical protein